MKTNKTKQQTGDLAKRLFAKRNSIAYVEIEITDESGMDIVRVPKR